MAYQAKHRFAPISARKARLVVDLVRGKSLQEAINIARFSRKRAGYLIGKLLMSAQANAQNKGEDAATNLYVKRAWADEGPTRTKYTPRARGMATPIRKRMSHIAVELDTIQMEQATEEA